MSTVLTRPTNGVSYGYKYVAVAQDDTDGVITIDFQVDYDLAAVVQILRAGVDVTGDAVITFPAAGQVTITEDTTYVIAVGDVIVIVANRASA